MTFLNTWSEMFCCARTI